ncbi:MAG: hypothetical protein JO104_08365 [Candidatus Eremiobacteraeota bacterium]|nr:hypothetical protein [Candidatus Eremiobacteraeota bacterium]
MRKREFAIVACGLLVAGCGSGGVAAAPFTQSAMESAEPLHAYKLLHSFGASGDGLQPEAKLIAVNGKLYGTTFGGGKYGSGTVFEITPSGSERVLYSFSGSGGDGASPEGALTTAGRVFYGTTVYGGTNGLGTVFSLTTGGKEHVIYSFDTTRGSKPAAGVLSINRVLYGTTTTGGAKYYGTVFSVSSGKAHVLHAFSGGKDGSDPHASLIRIGSELYSTTQQGGADGFGTVFGITTSGKERVVYSFRDQHDGEFPVAALIDVRGKLYGTASVGGSAGCGTVFEVSTSGSEHTIYENFNCAYDGGTPDGALVYYKGKFYSTTGSGGHDHYGTAFDVTPAGKFTLLHAFGNPGDGQTPLAGLVELDGKLYGTTAYGGKLGGGTIFSVAP